MNLEEKINELNYKYQFVKNNKYWNYDKSYTLTLNGETYKLFENDVLFSISKMIENNINLTDKDVNNVYDYELLNIDENTMRSIVTSFFMSIDPLLSDKLSFIFSKTTFIKYNDNIPKSEQRSVTTREGIKLYYKNNLDSLITLAHEVSHAISSLNDNMVPKNGEAVESLSEVESMLTEQLFLDYLKNNQLAIKDNNGEVRELNDEDLDDFKYIKYRGSIKHSFRALDEIGIKKIIRNNNINELNMSTLEIISNALHVPIEECIKRIEMFIDCYYPNNHVLHDFIGKKDYDLVNGKHLSNEARFIYANCLVEKFNNMNLSDEEKLEFYKMYLRNAKDMSFQTVLESFNVDLMNSNSFTQEFIDKFRLLSEDKKYQRGI